METLSKASKQALGDFVELAGLVNDYQNPGRAYRHTQGLLLAFLQDLEEKILSGVSAETGEDLTPYYRAQRLVAQTILSIPETIKRELTMQEGIHQHQIPISGPVESGEPPDLSDWPTFD